MDRGADEPGWLYQRAGNQHGGDEGEQEPQETPAGDDPMVAHGGGGLGEARVSSS